jgi:hypothetical protein
VPNYSPPALSFAGLLSDRNGASLVADRAAALDLDAVWPAESLERRRLCGREGTEVVVRLGAFFAAAHEIAG